MPLYLQYTILSTGEKQLNSELPLMFLSLAHERPCEWLIFPSSQECVNILNREMMACVLSTGHCSPKIGNSCQKSEVIKTIFLLVSHSVLNSWSPQDMFT